MLKTPIISIIIVSYNTKELTLSCLSSVFTGKKPEEVYEVIVVDNASTDDTVSFIQKNYPQVKVIRNTKNIGFAAANNIGIRIAKAPYILLLNSDAQVQKNTIKGMLQYIRLNSDIGVITCKLVLPNGMIDPACHRGFPTPWASMCYFLGLEKMFPKSKLFSGYHLGCRDLTTIHEIDCPSGAFFLTKKEVIEKVGLLDEDYFMYGEDIDWSFRIKNAGYKIIYNPNEQALHLKKQSGRSHMNNSLRKKTLGYFFDTMLLFYQKHYISRYPLVITVFVNMFVRLRVFILSTMGI